MFQGNVRIILCHLFHHRSPESGGIKHIRLVHAGHFLFAFSGDIKSLDGNPADLSFIVSQRIYRFSYAVLLRGLSLSEIETACQFAHNQHIKTFFGNFCFQRTCPGQLLIQNRRAKIGKKI